MRSPLELGAYPPSLGHHLRRWAAAAPERLFLAERTDGGGWREVRWGEALGRVRALGQALLDRGLTAERPLALLSDNGVDHALLQLAAMDVGVPAVPISPAYSLLSRDHGRLRHMLRLTTPGMVYAGDGAAYAAALARLPADVAVVVGRRPPPGAELLAELEGTTPGGAAEEAFAAVGPETVAKILFTSGSTGRPRGVINSQRMLCSNQRMIARLWPFLEQRPPLLVDWLPWSHTFGGNHNFNLVLANGGTLYVDGGKPVPGRIETTVENLRAVSPTLYFNVPRGFDALLPFLEADAELAARFFRRLDLIFYAGAALPQNLWQRLDALARRLRGAPLFLTTAWGTTETAPLATSAHFPLERAGNVGLPAPGCEVRLTPVGEAFELRVRGPNVTPGYHRDPAATAAAFDGDGFFKTGDAGRLADPHDPARGILFDGRIGENFKLGSGTWVDAGKLRLAAIAAGEPVIQDAVVTGHDRGAVGLLVVPSLEGCRRVCGDDALELAELVRRPEVKEHLRAGLAAHNLAHPGSSRRIERALLMVEPPSIDAGEITDKGYLNQRAMRERRAALIERLYAGDGDDVVVV
ncbi:MAG: feruloyl-CoA synthase [Acidobacteria bacterium]|nr:MAG: feruloyl-CoA synthase [Acidobacteriota bacterium]